MADDAQRYAFFILGKYVALRIKNWQFDEGCMLHIMLQQ